MVKTKWQFVCEKPFMCSRRHPKPNPMAHGNIVKVYERIYDGRVQRREDFVNGNHIEVGIPYFGIN